MTEAPEQRPNQMSGPPPWARDPVEVARELGVDPEVGLMPRQAADRLATFGPNQLAAVARRGWLSILAAQFRSLVVVLLAVAAVTSFAFADVGEGLAIVAVLALNAAIGFLTEQRAVRSVEALRQLGQVMATVRRGGQVVRVPAEDLVVGDVVLVDAGDVVPADLRLVGSARLETDESALTGESVPVAKSADPVPVEAPLAERTSMVFKGSAVTQGGGAGVAVGTGADTEVGRISSLVRPARGEATPLQTRLDRLGRRLVWLTAVVVAAVVVAGLIGGHGLGLTLRTAVALAVAAIPEGLPVVATLALARGMVRMARRNALVERLPAVETLGSANVILTDKTGTLTQNRMTVAALDPPGEARQRALTIGVLCNQATLGDGTDESGDPMERALLEAAVAEGLSTAALRRQHPTVRVEAFDPAKKMMATVHEAGGRLLVTVKGAPEAVLAACDRIATKGADASLDGSGRAEWLGRADRLAGQGLRVLAVADRTGGRVDEDPYAALTLVGLVGLLDPPRERVPEAIRRCREAGIKVVMVTGDHLRTGQAIGHRIGLSGPEDVVTTGNQLRPVPDLPAAERDRLRRAVVIARASPEHKIDLLDLHQAGGDVVAMIGDGVNDAPALSKADIGVAMGKRGTEVARQAADMVLRDDRFETIVSAVEQGRTIFDSIRRFVVYLLSCNLSEIIVVGVAALIGGPLPLNPIQILFLNLVTDVFPALALGLGEASGDVLRRPPRRPSEPVLLGGHWRRIGGYAALIGAACLGSLALAIKWLAMPTAQATTISFLTLAFAQLWHVFNMADHGSALLRNEVSRNRLVWSAIALCVLLLLAGVYLPGVSDALEVMDPGLTGWAVIVGMSLLPLVVGRAAHVVLRALGR